VIGTSQRKSAGPVSPLSSDAFEQLLRLAAANSAVIRGRSICARSISGSPELGLIGETAGVVWHILSNLGPTTFALLIEAVGVPESLFFMAVGWLARENKITIEPHDGDYEMRLK
jgi:Winged helix-turn-helix domain (DUF2582)